MKLDFITGIVSENRCRLGHLTSPSLADFDYELNITVSLDFQKSYTN